jgi:hypothetical protein
MPAQTTKKIVGNTRQANCRYAFMTVGLERSLQSRVDCGFSTHLGTVRHLACQISPARERIVSSSDKPTSIVTATQTTPIKDSSGSWRNVPSQVLPTQKNPIANRSGS